MTVYRLTRSVIDGDPDTSTLRFAADAERAVFTKDIILQGDWTHPTAGWTLEVTPEAIDAWITASKSMLAAGIPIRFTRDHGQGVDAVLGRVLDLWRDGDKAHAKIEVVGAEAIGLVQRSPWVSVEIAKDFVAGNGQRYGAAITAVSLVPDPVVTPQGDFQRIAAARSAAVPPGVTREMIDMAYDRGRSSPASGGAGPVTDEMVDMAYPHAK